MQANRISFLRNFTKFVKERSAAGIVNAEISIYKSDFEGVFYKYAENEVIWSFPPETLQPILDSLWKDYQDLALKWINRGKRPTWGSHGVPKSIIGPEEMHLKLYGNQIIKGGPKKGQISSNLPQKNWVDNVVKSFRSNVNKPLEQKVNKHGPVIKKIIAEHGETTAAAGGQKPPQQAFPGAGQTRLPGGKGNNVHNAIIKALKLSAKNGNIKWYTEVVQGYMNYIFESGIDKRKTAKSLQVGHTIKLIMIPNSAQHGGDDRQVSADTKDFFGAQGGFKRIVKEYVKKHLAGDITAINAFNSASPDYTDELTDMGLKVVLSDIYQTTKIRPDMRLRVNKKMAQNIKAATKKSNGSIRTKSNKIRHSAKAAVFGGKVGKKPKGQRGQGKTAQSPIALRNLLNEMLPQMVASKMTPPALQYRTGRFANSARVENVNVGPRGGIDIDYTYMREPYETFEPGNKQGSTRRDPRKIIGASIRELAMGILGRNPTTIRRQ